MNENNSTKLILILTTILFVCLATTKRANAQFGLGTLPIDVLYT